MLINDGSQNLTLTTVAGTISNTFQNVANRRLVQLTVNPTTATTEYDVQLIDHDDNVIFEVNDWVGRMNVYSNSLPEYVYGNFTFKILNASANEAFTVKVVFSEETT